MPQGFSKSQRLRSRQEFRNVFKHGSHRQGRLLSIHSCPAPTAKLGISVSKKFGHAPARSLFKRYVREAFRLGTWPALAIHVRPSFQARTATFSEIQEEMRYLLTVNPTCERI